MTDLAIRIKDLPAWAVAGILELLELANQSHPAALSILMFTHTKGVVMGEITVQDTEASLTAKVVALDAEGHETTFDQAPTWESSDEAVASVTPSDDGYSAEVAVGAPGSAVITVTGVENSTGEDVEIVSTGLINVTAGDATVGSVEFSTGDQPQVEPV